ncbi:tetratricopeptide repeat protein [Arenimonas oryziterrae]|uniref:Tetratricopeptide repeat-like domain-containing protein n=1 Tax=Arenimonas oryziterrae DSM 21050 = YC6267 TaxID=1121015 RepID=A0A091AU95_9GAMM|nr:tetratricopeptide repeat protein [Arenimonas oryziterrae]KFN43803.1 hypothetical protein N789_07610 [Arenimonas oryziterrae DSM 21050 = YC6267]
MKKSLLLSAALAAVLLPMPVMQAYAQTDTGPGRVQANTRANRRAQAAGKEGTTTAAAAMFPNATRVDPKQEGAKELSKQLSALFDLQEGDKADQAIAKADEILANPKANAFDRATAAYIAGYAWLGKDGENYPAALKYLERAISENGLSNNTHFQMLLQIAQIQSELEQYPASLATVDRYLSETKSENPKAYGLKGFVLYRMERYADSAEAVKKAIALSPTPDDNNIRLLMANYLELDKPEEAAKIIEEMLAKKPNDKALLQNLASVYQQAGQDAKASAAFDRMRAAGLMTETKDYENAYRLLANIEGRDKDAMAIINEGLQKGLLTPNFDLYTYMGNIYYNADQIPQAIDAWNKAAPLGKDGETYLNLAKLHVTEDHWTEARAAAQQALAKGVKKKGDAWIVIGRAEFGLGNKAAVLAAYREAAKYPETKKSAEQALRQAGAK